MNNEVRNEFAASYARLQESESSILHVFHTTCSWFLKTSNKWSVEAMLYTDLIGTRKSDERAALFEEFKNQYPWVEYNGGERVNVDFVPVEKSDLEKLNLAIRAYRFAGHKDKESKKWIQSDVVRLDECIGHLEIEGDEVPLMKDYEITHDSGYVEKIRRQAKDEKGNPMTEKRMVMYKPRTKTSWGYTDEFLNAFISALETLCK